MIHIILDFDSCFFEQACIKLMQIWCENFRKLFYMDKNLCFDLQDWIECSNSYFDLIWFFLQWKVGLFLIKEVICYFLSTKNCIHSIEVICVDTAKSLVTLALEFFPYNEKTLKTR